MSLELGKNSKGYPLKKRIVTTYRGSLKPPPKYTKQFDTTEVWDGEDYIWPIIVPQEPVIIEDVTSLQIRYIWNNESGDNLDTSAFYINSPNGLLNYQKVGHGQGNYSLIPYLYWGGDSIVSGADCMMLDFGAFKDYSNLPEVIDVALGARWSGEVNTGDLRMEVTAYKGGTIVHAYQIRNLDDLANNGSYLYPTADGTVYVTNSVTGQIEKCWYGEAIRVTQNGIESYYKINPVDDSIIGLPQDLNIKVERISSLTTHHYESGWLVPNEGVNGERIKIWNNQYNMAPPSLVSAGDYTAIKTMLTPYLEGNTSINVMYCKVMLNSKGTREGVERYRLNCDTFGFGFVAGNSEFRGQYILKLNVPDGSTVENPYLAGSISYMNSDGTTIVDTVEPIEDKFIEDIINS